MSADDDDAGYTCRITDNAGTRFAHVTPRKRRKSPRALRFAELKVGDHLMRDLMTYDDRKQVWYYIVTDLWFDPVAGQDDELAGRMVAIRLIDPRTGDPRPRKEPHTLRGLASQGFHYADLNYIEHVRQFREGASSGAVVGIGKGYVIRRRPKLPSARF